MKNISIKNRSFLYDFAAHQDFAFSYAVGSGICFANEESARGEIAKAITIAKDIQLMSSLDEPGAADLAEEAKNGCDIYKICADDCQDNLFIAYYD